MVQKWIIIKRLGVLLGLFGFLVAWNVLAVYGAIQLIKRMGWL